MAKLVRNVTALLALMVLTTAVSATGKPEGVQKPKNDIVDVALEKSFQTLDVQATTAYPTPYPGIMIYEGLFAFGKGFTIVPDLAESYEASADGTQWVFKLHKGVKFHNGSEMTAADVKASLMRFAKIAPNSAELKDIVSIDEVDAYTVKITFSKAHGAYLLITLGSDKNKAAIMPREVAEAYPQANSLPTDKLIGTGPYKVESYTPDSVLKLVRFVGYVPRGTKPNYQGGRKEAIAPEIDYWIVPEASSRVAGLETGEYDIANILPITEYSRLKAKAYIVPIKQVPEGNDFFTFNHKKGLMTNINMRKAIQAIVDTKEIAKAETGSEDFSWFDPGMMPANTPYYTRAGAEYLNQKNVALAKEYLAKAGYNGEIIRIITYTEEEWQKNGCLALTAQLKAAGLNADLQAMDISTWIQTRANEDKWDIFMSGATYVDPTEWANLLTGKWPSWFSSDQTNSIFQSLSLEVSVEKRKELTDRLQKTLYDQVAIIQIGKRTQLVGMLKSVQDPEHNVGIGFPTLHYVHIGQ